jgi:hypothetical protein
MNRGGWEGLNMSTIWLGMLLGLPHLEVAGWGGIYSTNQIVAVGEGCWRWAHRTVRCATGQCPVHRHVILFVRVRAGRPLEALSLCGTGQSSAPLTFCSDIWIALFTLQSRPLRADSRWSAGAPDSPVNYSGAAPVKPEAEEFELIHPGALDTARWHTRQSGAPDQGTHRFPFCSFLLKPNSFFWLVCVEPLAPVKCMI